MHTTGVVIMLANTNGEQCVADLSSPTSLAAYVFSESLYTATEIVLQNKGGLSHEQESRELRRRRGGVC